MRSRLSQCIFFYCFPALFILDELSIIYIPLELPLYLYLLFFVIAFIYGSVGHGGASGYMALLSLAGLFTPEMVPVILILNILVSSVSFANYGSHGHFSLKLFWPFALGSVPAAFTGGLVNIDSGYFSILAGLVLIISAVIILIRARQSSADEKLKPLHLPVALFSGVSIGFLSGLIGVGGGIFLSPLIYFLKWGRIRRIAAVSALFILVNSASGLTGHALNSEILWSTALLPAIPVLAGGYLGSRLGIKFISSEYIKMMLALVLLIAGFKMLIL